MARIVIAASAGADTEGIFRYLAAEAGWRTAAKYGALRERLDDRLAAQPAIGAPRPALGRDIRIGIVSPYIVICRHTEADDTVTVLRVVHGRRRITGRLLAETP
jgi:toxin ParE1/3/4